VDDRHAQAGVELGSAHEDLPSNGIVEGEGFRVGDLLLVLLEIDTRSGQAERAEEPAQVEIVGLLI
jgi:hypothetical protein